MAHVAVICESSLAGLSQEELTELILQEKVVGNEVPMYVVLVEMGFAESRSQARAQIKQNGVNVGPDKIIVKENDTVIFLTRKKEE